MSVKGMLCHFGAREVRLVLLQRGEPLVFSRLHKARQRASHTIRDLKAQYYTEKKVGLELVPHAYIVYSTS